MDVSFEDQSLDRLETDASFSAGFGDAVVKAYRRRMQQIRAARDERTFYAQRSLNFEKLKGSYNEKRHLQYEFVLYQIPVSEIKVTSYLSYMVSECIGPHC